MNNYCRNCGTKLENENICPKCSVEVIDKRVDVDNKKAEIEKLKTDERNAIIVLVCLYAAQYISTFLSKYIEALSTLTPTLSLASLVYLIYARVRYSKSKVIRVIFIIFITLTVLNYLLALILIISCLNACAAIG